MRYKYTDVENISYELNIGVDKDGRPELHGLNVDDSGWANAANLTVYLLLHIVADIAHVEQASLPGDAPVWAKRAQEEGRLPQVMLNTCAGLQNKLKEAVQLIEVAAKNIGELEIDNNNLKGNMQRLVELSMKSDVSFSRVMYLEKQILERIAEENIRVAPDTKLLDWLKTMMEFKPSKEQLN